MPEHRPANIIETINRLMRTSCAMFREIGREPMSEELAERLAIPVDAVRRLLDIASTPIALRT